MVGNSKDVLSKILKIFLTSNCFFKVLSWKRALIYELYNSHCQSLMKSTLINGFTGNNQDTLRLKITKKAYKFDLKSFCEYGT